MLVLAGPYPAGTESVRGGISLAEYSHSHGVTIHEGPMADKRGTGWRDDAAKLEALNQKRIQNPMQTLPNTMTTLDKPHAKRARSDEGTADESDIFTGGDRIGLDG